MTQKSELRAKAEAYEEYAFALKRKIGDLYDVIIAFVDGMEIIHEDEETISFIMKQEDHDLISQIQELIFYEGITEDHEKEKFRSRKINDYYHGKVVD